MKVKSDKFIIILKKLRSQKFHTTTLIFQILENNTKQFTFKLSVYLMRPSL